MEINNFNLSIKDYIGLIDNGVSIIISCLYKENIYEILYWYDFDNDLLTLDDVLENLLDESDKNDSIKILEWIRTEREDYSSIKDKLPVLK